MGSLCGKQKPAQPEIICHPAEGLHHLFGKPFATVFFQDENVAEIGKSSSVRDHAAKAHLYSCCIVYADADRKFYGPQYSLYRNALCPVAVLVQVMVYDRGLQAIFIRRK